MVFVIDMTNTEKALQHYRAMLKAHEECPIDGDIAVFTREAIAALEKQTPKPPVYIYSDEPLCPYCREPVEDGDKVCECGQRLKWEE